MEKIKSKTEKKTLLKIKAKKKGNIEIPGEPPLTRGDVAKGGSTSNSKTKPIK